ncbi:hypothetical protein E2C01_009930 [Portunus trituberculatus]|uniref:Uncharacterized protein n=1 Tax=Portunus trituberculatus TaxID=210409 RepID=A0A5B7D735_PORTR|nr:hypothetical protein [Portunus trituberculatus]
MAATATSGHSPCSTPPADPATHTLPNTLHAPSFPFLTLPRIILALPHATPASVTFPATAVTSLFLTLPDIHSSPLCLASPPSTLCYILLSKRTFSFILVLSHPFLTLPHILTRPALYKTVLKY